jgi:outer membrane protein TolC
VAVLNNQEQIKQLEYLLKQYYLSLKTLCDIPEQEQIIIAQKLPQNPESEANTVVLTALAISNSLLKEKYAWSNYRQTVKSNLPTLSFTQSNSYTLYNQDFKLFDGKWYKGASIGFKLAIPMPNANSIGNRTKAKYDYELARKNTEQETIKANLVQTQLQVDYDKALSQARSNKEIFELRKDSYQKNKMLYEQGLLGLDQTLNSYTAMVNAGYNLTTSSINVQLAQAKININNKFK